MPCIKKKRKQWTKFHSFPDREMYFLKNQFGVCCTSRQSFLFLKIHKIHKIYKIHKNYIIDKIKEFPLQAD